MARRWALGGTALGLLAALAYAGFARQTPLPPPLLWPQLALPGAASAPEIAAQHQQHHRLAHGDVVSFKLSGPEAGRNWALTLTPVRVSSHDFLRLNYLRERIPSMAMTHGDDASKTPSDSAPSTAKLDLAYGQAGGLPAAQACITTTGVASALQATLSAEASKGRASGIVDRVAVFLGLADPIPWQCVLVTLRSDQPDATEAQLLAQWQWLMTHWRGAKVWPQP
jgi:hypothetical protein